MVFGLRLDGHQPHAAVRLGRDAVGAGRLLRGLQRVEAVEMPVQGPGRGPAQGPARQDRAALAPAPLRGVLGALHGRPLPSGDKRVGAEGYENQGGDEQCFHLYPLLLTPGVIRAWL